VSEKLRSEKKTVRIVDIETIKKQATINSHPLPPPWEGGRAGKINAVVSPLCHRCCCRGAGALRRSCGRKRKQLGSSFLKQKQCKQQYQLTLIVPPPGKKGQRGKDQCRGLPLDHASCCCWRERCRRREVAVGKENS
jgi:hypothetical protein